MFPSLVVLYWPPPVTRLGEPPAMTMLNKNTPFAIESRIWSGTLVICSGLRSFAVVFDGSASLCTSGNAQLSPVGLLQRNYLCNVTVNKTPKSNRMQASHDRMQLWPASPMQPSTHFPDAKHSFQKPIALRGGQNAAHPPHEWQSTRLCDAQVTWARLQVLPFTRPSFLSFFQAELAISWNATKLPWSLQHVPWLYFTPSAILVLQESVILREQVLEIQFNLYCDYIHENLCFLMWSERKIPKENYRRLPWSPPGGGSLVAPPIHSPWDAHWPPRVW